MELVSIKIRKQLLNALKLIKEERKLRSISDVIEFLLDLYLSKEYKISTLLADIKTKLQEVEYLLKEGSKEVVVSEKIPPSYHQEATTTSGTSDQITTTLPPEEESVTTTTTTELPPSVPTETPKRFSIYDYCVMDQSLKPKLEQIAKEAHEYGYDYEILKVKDDIYALVLKPNMRATFRIQDREFKLKEIMKRTLWIRKSDLLVLAFRALRTINIDIYSYGKKIATLRAPF